MRVVTEKGTADRVRSGMVFLTVVLCRSSANDLDLQMRRGRQSQPSGHGETVPVSLMAAFNTQVHAVDQYHRYERS
jgi:hypothetical protein